MILKEIFFYFKVILWRFICVYFLKNNLILIIKNGFFNGWIYIFCYNWMKYYMVFSVILVEFFYIYEIVYFKMI